MINIWRKNSADLPLIPNIDEDVAIGAASIDLTVLVACLPSIDGWFNIIDISGCINGQMKVRISTLKCNF